MSTPTTPADMFTTLLAQGADVLKPLLSGSILQLIGLGAFFWAGRLVLEKLGMDGAVARLGGDDSRGSKRAKGRYQPNAYERANDQRW